MSGTLYIVPTPIGNLGDMTLRAKETLESVDFIASEDTRVGGKLLMLLGIKKPLVSYHEHSQKPIIEAITERILSGENCALITDAGTPAVSDPGEKLVDACAEAGVNICALPGACAAVTAISASGLKSRRFCFEGFLPENANERKERIAELSREKRTFILYISPHDAEKYLKELAKPLSDRKCVLAKEVTKLHERYFRGTVASVAETFINLSASEKKGEFVFICEGMPEEEAFWKEMTVEEHVEHYISLGLSKMDSCKAAARDRGVGKGDIYKVINR
ncbi:MAG: 16S rRNA (cytidine(1402)-2'-O)-methyltransferase [Clostridia bacterium]|nr:16S rRNA (cytidine(1402)-2'-O)-methyltransferase [Clostridia bacterium]